MTPKYPRTYHLPISPGTTSDDRIAASVDGVLNKRVVITEKLDGGNISHTELGIYARSHATFTQNPWDGKMWELWEDIKDYLGDLELFGENMWAVHSIEYQRLDAFYYLFGVREGEMWYSWKQVEETAFLLDLKTVPVLFDGIFATEQELYDKVNELVTQESVFGGAREGVVVRQYDGFNTNEFSNVVLKWVRKGHVQTDTHWTKMWAQGKGPKHELNWK
jgi:hypothetical protein